MKQDYSRYDHRVKRYSATTVDEAFGFLVEDPKNFFRPVFRNITKQRFSQDDEQEFFAYLSSYFWNKNHLQPQKFLEQFNASGFPFTIAAIIRNQTHSRAGFQLMIAPKTLSEQIELDNDNIEAPDLPNGEDPYEILERKSRSVHPRDHDHLVWLLNTDACLENFSGKQRRIFQAHLEALRLSINQRSRTAV